MKKFTSLFVLYLLIAGCASIPNVIHPYSDPVSVEAATTKIQDEHNPDAQITATEYKFPFLVRDIVVDSTEMKALVRLRIPDEKPTKVPSILVYYDLIDKKVLWTKRSYAWFPEFLNNKIIINSTGKIFALNKKTGEMIWERAGRYGYINHEKNFALTGLLTGIDLNTGTDTWHRDVESQFGWEELKVDGESLIASIDGLHTFNLQNGNGWDIEMSTGKKGEVGAAAATVGLYALGALTGNIVTGSVKANEFSGMTSNILVCGDHIFFAAKDNLVCVEKETGKEIWRTVLPEKKTAKSVLLEKDDHIVLANKSYCFKNNEFHRYGIPYTAKFDKATGEQMFSENLDTRSYIQDVQLAENGYYVITENELVMFGMNGKLNAKLDLSEKNEKYGNNLELLAEDYAFVNYFVQENQAFVPLKNYLIDPTVPAVETDNGVLILDTDLDIQQWLPKKQIYLLVDENSSVKLLRNVKFSALKAELNKLEYRLEYGSLAQRKKTQKRYNFIKDEYRDLLRDIYIVDNRGSMKGKIKITENLFPAKNHFYFTSENGLTLISKTEMK